MKEKIWLKQINELLEYIKTDRNRCSNDYNLLIHGHTIGSFELEPIEKQKYKSYLEGRLGSIRMIEYYIEDTVKKPLEEYLIFQKLNKE